MTILTNKKRHSLPLSFRAAALVAGLALGYSSVQAYEVVVYPAYNMNTGAYNNGNKNKLTELYGSKFKELHGISVNSRSGPAGHPFKDNGILNHLKQNGGDIGLVTTYIRTPGGIYANHTLVDGVRGELTGQFFSEHATLQEVNQSAVVGFRELIQKRYRTTPPLTSLWHSAILPGWGQIDNDNYFLGILFGVGHVGLLAFAANLGLQGQANVDEYESTIDTERQRALKNENEDLIATQEIIILAWAGLYLVNLLDAYVNFSDVFTASAARPTVKTYYAMAEKPGTEKQTKINVELGYTLRY